MNEIKPLICECGHGQKFHAQRGIGFCFGVNYIREIEIECKCKKFRERIKR